MSLHVTLSDFRSRDLMGMHNPALDVVDRPCPIGDDPDSILLTQNGPVEMRYSPAFNHYYFSRLPEERWFTDYYASAWMSSDYRGIRALAHKGIETLKRPARVVRSHMRKMLGRVTATENAVKWDIERYCMLLRPYLTSQGQVLDVGCGTGDFLLPYLQAGIRCAGIEPSEANSKIARRRGVNILNSPLSDTPEIRQLIASSDVVFSNHSLEHHYDPNRFFRLCSEEMRDGTVLSISVPNTDVEILMLQNIYMLHIDGYTEQSLEAMFHKYGFEVLHKEVGPQLRFLAIKRMPQPLMKKQSVWNAEEFCRAYQKKYLEQIFLSPKEGSKTFPFRFGYKGARPYTKWSYDVYPKDFPKGPIRVVEGTLTLTDETQKALIVYETESASQARLLLK